MDRDAWPQPAKYGRSADGLHAYADEQLGWWRRCEAAHGTRRCAFLFENLDKELKGSFFACDQLIRGIYHPFVAEWHAAFGGGVQLLVLRADELLDRATAARARVLRFLDLPNPQTLTPPLSTSYARLHAASLRSYRAVPMHNHTRRLLDSFYAPYTARVATLLGWEPGTWQASTPSTAADLMGSTGIVYKRYGPYESRATKYGASGPN